MGQIQMQIASEHQAVVASEIFRIDQTATADLLDGELEQSSCRDIRNDADMNPVLPSQNGEDQNSAGRCSTMFALAPVSEVGFIEVYFTASKSSRILRVRLGWPFRLR